MHSSEVVAESAILYDMSAYWRTLFYTVIFSTCQESNLLLLGKNCLAWRVSINQIFIFEIIENKLINRRSETFL